MTMIQKWQQVEQSHSHCTEWIKAAEDQLIAIDFKTTLAEKQDQLQRITVRH